MGEPRETKRRFAPVPIETTFQSNRKAQHVGPTAELTPDASPVSEKPPTREFGGERRRFAPQLIETSRRAYRVGDLGPATKPTDKTDITPYTKNIYNVTKPRGRRRLDSINNDGPSLWTMPPTRRETEDPAVKNYLLELAAKEAERQIQEAALAAFPNSRAREGGVAHFYYRESSGSDESPDEPVHPAAKPTRDHASRPRRQSSNLGMNWWHKHMQDHAKQLGLERGDVDDEAVVVTDDEDVNMVSDAELDGMEFNVPPDPLWTTSGKATPAQRRDSGEVAAARAAADAALGARNEDAVMRDAPPPATSKAPELPYSNTFLNKSAAPQAQNVGRPFGQFAYKPDAAQLAKASQLKSPPMLGKDIKFRRCPSPKLTKLEPNHPFFQDPDESGNRDITGKNGLWHGFCFDSGREASGPMGPRMLATPAVPGSPAEPAELDSRSISEEPVSLFSATGSSIDTTSSAEYRLKSGSQAQGSHSLEERLRLEEAEAERNEKIAQEFNDEFITQVYNYLSLGYPATACIFDEELAKVSHTTEAHLRSRDEEQNAKGHMLEFEIGDTKEEDRCPRWRALKVYILEWARQHPDLDNLDPLAWGVRERRGSWAF